MAATYIDVDDETFETEILARSEQVPVVVDLWAEWCGPCRSLGPIIERVVGETEGKVVLAKVDTDANPRLSQLFRVQSIPAVYALKDRKIVSQFIGAQPEHVVRQFVEALLPTPEELELADLLEVGDEPSLTRALELHPGHPGATVALAELLVHAGRSEEALEVLAKIPESDETRRVAALARTGDESPGEDVEARLRALLPQVKADDDARQAYLDLLELMGDDPRVPELRKELSRQLF